MQKAAESPDPFHIRSAAQLYDISALLRSTWRDLSASDRDRLLADLMAAAAKLRRSFEPSGTRPDGPTEAEVRAQCARPTSHVVLQPIVWLPTGEVVGFEALTRFREWPPDRWFRQAWEMGAGLELELLAVRRALPTIATLPDDIYVGINVSPVTLISSELSTMLRTSEPQRIVLEMTEHAPIQDYALYGDGIRRLRGHGVRIAIDDVGAGHSSLQHIIRLGPDVIKLDRALIAGCDSDPVKRVLMKCFATFAHETRTSLVAEGVETAEEAAALISYGVAFGQGYYFGAPQRDPTLTVSTETGGWLPIPVSH